MNTIVERWLKFNLVGFLGLPVQLAALALFNRWLNGHYLVATALAVEAALLHNFVWHVHYTWRDCRDRAPRLQQLLRFHLLNGVVSFAGNLALMTLLVRAAHLPVLAANAIAIATCSTANFLLSHRWTFALRQQPARSPSGTALGLLLLLVPIFFEVGVMGPQANRSHLSGYYSVDGRLPLSRSSATYVPQALVGYSRLFETGHAFDYGLALELPRFGSAADSTKSVRLELRDYWTFSHPTQHNLMRCVGWLEKSID